MMLLLATFLTIAAQSSEAAPAETAPPPPDANWELLDAVVFQAGDEPITRSDVWIHMQRTQARLGLSVTTEAEQLELLNRSLDSLVTLALEAQAGEDREVDPAGLETRIEQFLAARRQDRPLRDYVDSLEQAGVSAHSERDINKAGYYQSSFRSQGKIGPRPTRDGYIRPGELREYYRTNAQPLLGGEATYRFQDLVITIDQVGSEADARKLAGELRTRLLDGEDFGELHDQFGTTQLATRGVTERFGPDNPLPDPEARGFAERNEPGAISPVMAIQDRRRPGQIVAFRILRLHEKTPGTPPPPFATATAQDTLRTWLEEKRDEAWLTYARGQLHGTAYLWPGAASGGASKPAGTPTGSTPKP